MADRIDKVVLITGGSRGIGAATALLAAQNGYRVCISYRSARSAAEAVAEEIRRGGGQALALPCDVADENDIVALFEAVDREFGRLDALVNNAGMLEMQSRVEHMQAARLQRVFSTNVIGSFICAREAIRRMSTRNGGQGGAIVNLSSVAARLGAPGEYIDYAASKGAIDTFTLGLAKEVAGEGIRVNAVRPGVIHTGIHASGGEPDRVERVSQSVPMLRGGQPEEVAQAILWLLSEQASYVAGAIIDVTGGR
ncbi:SDR family oxidoreductase [Lacisediminimonas profundi]|uniref:SDR family oxidoreductase n=1 Tax=Lacisediminimonas profundi TaxID=2603856 RepID=UPI0019D516BE|nr:SDR family oxidoreductase [Lacisediminimonas profundi]